MQDLSTQSLTHSQALQLIEHWWSTGNLRGLLYPHQWIGYDLFYSNTAMTNVFHWSRRTGKSTVDLILLMEQCLAEDGSICRFGSTTQDSVREIILPTMNTLCQLAPPKLRPYYHSSGRFLFPHRPRSQLVIAGLDMYPDRLRGPACHRAAIDEAGFIKDLDYVIKDIIMPQFMTTDGRLLLSSTSPKTPAHPFVDRMEGAKEDKAYLLLDIYQDSRPEVIAKIPLFMKEAGGENSTTWQREYLCKIIIDQDAALIPEFAKPDVESRIVKKWEKPSYLIPYTFIDLGYVDNAAAIFGYTDFKHAKRVILGELCIRGKNSRDIRDAIVAKEREIWGEDKRHLVRRYADGQPLTIADFNELYDLPLTKVAEDTVEAKVNRVRLDVTSGTLIIDPSCIGLIRELKYGVWDDARKKFARMSGFGHFDLLSALTYFCMHTSLSDNPYPEDFEYDPVRQMRSKQWTRQEDELSRELKSVFGLDRRS